MSLSVVCPRLKNSSGEPFKVNDQPPEPRSKNEWVNLITPPGWANGEWGWFSKLFYVAWMAGGLYLLFLLANWIKGG